MFPILLRFLVQLILWDTAGEGCRSHAFNDDPKVEVMPESPRKFVYQDLFTYGFDP